MTPLLSYQRGLHLRDSPLWLDAVTARDLCFVSHALVPAARRHTRVVTSELTSDLLRALGGVSGAHEAEGSPRWLVASWGQRFSLGDIGLELLPSGHVLGAASLLVQLRGKRILYAGPLGFSASPLVERLEARACDVLVLACGAALKAQESDQDRQIKADIVTFVEKSWATDRTPVLFCAPVGGAQQLVATLAAAGFQMRAHRQVWAACRVYAKRAVAVCADAVALLRRHEAARPPDLSQRLEVVLWPMGLHRSKALAKLGPVCTAWVTALPQQSTGREVPSVEAAFSLQTLAESKDLLDYAQACSPERVLLLGRAPAELVEGLSRRGMAVETIGSSHQLDLFGSLST